MKRRVTTVLLAAVLLLSALSVQLTAKAATINCKNDIYVKDAQLGITGWSSTHESAWVSSTLHCNTQGMSVAGSYIYSAIAFHKKVNGSFANGKDSYFQIMRSKIGTGTTRKDKDVLKFNGSANLVFLGHANDMCAFTYGNKTYLFITRGDTHLVLLTVSGTKITEYRKVSTDRKTMGITFMGNSGSKYKFAIKDFAHTPTAFTFTLDMKEVLKIAAVTKNRLDDKKDKETAIKTTAGTKLNLDIPKKLTDIYGSFTKWSYQGFTYNRDNGYWYVPAFVEKTVKNNDNRFYSCYFVFNSSGKYVKYVKLSYSMELEAMDFRGDRIYFVAITRPNSDTPYKGHNSILFGYKYK